MNNRAHYATLVDGIFGSGMATFDLTDPQPNNVIRALGNRGKFGTFSANFEQRLRRLAASLNADRTLRNNILANPQLLWPS